MNKLRLYLDNCSFNRPFDNQEYLTINIETQAKLMIQEKIKNNAHILVWSYMLDIENDDNIEIERIESIGKWKTIATDIIKESNNIIVENIIKLLKIGIHEKDAVHLACAIYANCDYFITTDRKLLNKEVEGIKIINPIEFVKKEENYE
jgi:predicted nucleic acid-binding protein